MFSLFVLGIESFTIHTPSAKLVLKSALDYEHTTSYVLTLKITDTGKATQPSGNISIKVNKSNNPLESKWHSGWCLLSSVYKLKR